jgi:WD repeat-containing protein 35
MLALAGTREQQPNQLEVVFYTPFGRHVSSLKVPGPAAGFHGLAWEGGGLRLSLAMDSSVIFATARPTYRWCALSDGTIVYSYSRPDKVESVVVFWHPQQQRDEKQVKYVKRLISVHAAGENCILVTGSDNESTPSSQGGGISGMARSHSGTPVAPQYVLILCNSIGVPAESKYCDIRPDHVTSTSTHVAVADSSRVLVWQFRANISKLALLGITPMPAGTSAASLGGANALTSALTDHDPSVGVGLTNTGSMKERVFGIDEDSDAAAAAAILSGTRRTAGSSATPNGAATQAGAKGTADPIACMAASDKCLLVARESGVVQRYALPSLSLMARYKLRCKANTMQINCDSTRFALIDPSNVLSLFDMEGKEEESAAAADAPHAQRPAAAAGASSTGFSGVHLPMERRDVWSVLWADDYPDLWAAMEKTRMYVFRGTDPEEPVLSPGYIARFSDLTITSVLLDDIYTLSPEAPDAAHHWVAYECRSLRDTRTLLARNGLKDTLSFVADNGHPRLWRLLAESALEKLDLSTAEKAFVSCLDYPGIQFVKRLRLLRDRNKQRAEVCIFFRKFDEAEVVYREMDRIDLAVEMYMRVGDWERVMVLLDGESSRVAESGGKVPRALFGDDLLTLAQSRLGDFWADRQHWHRAAKYYKRARRYEALVECYYVVENFRSLELLIDELPEGAPSTLELLQNIGQKLESVGLVDSAAKAYGKAGNVRAAVDCCVALNEWEKAVKLAEEGQLPGIEDLLSKYSAHLLEAKKPFAAIELFRKAGRPAEAARLLAKLASEEGKARTNPVQAKQLYVLAALEVSEHRRRAARASDTGGLTNDATSLMGRTVDVAWQGAEAYHFYMLAQRQLYAGDITAAMTTASRLCLYEDLLPSSKDVYSILALTSYYNGCYGTCSKSFMKLETIVDSGASDLFGQVAGAFGDAFSASTSLEPSAGAKSAHNDAGLRDAYNDLSLEIFSRVAPLDPPLEQSIACPGGTAAGVCRAPLKPWDVNCMACGMNFPACIASGRPIHSGLDYWRCRTCNHKAIPSEIEGWKNCPLCHHPRSAGGAAGSKGDDDFDD